MGPQISPCWNLFRSTILLKGLFSCVIPNSGAAKAPSLNDFTTAHRRTSNATLTYSSDLWGLLILEMFSLPRCKRWGVGGNGRWTRKGRSSQHLRYGFVPGLQARTSDHNRPSTLTSLERP